MSRSFQSATSLHRGDRGYPRKHTSKAGLICCSGILRVALVRYGARARLALGEGLFDLANLGSLQRPDLRRELLERRADQRERRDELCVPVPLDDLAADWSHGRKT